MQKKYFLVFALLLPLAGCDNSSNGSAKSPPPAAVDVVTLRSEPVTQITQLPGRTTAVRTAEVRPQVSGIIEKRLFNEGAEVQAGERLYQIDPATYQAEVHRAEAAWRNAVRLAKRYQALWQTRAISRQTYDDATTSADEAKAALDTARINLDYTRVRAPISGRIDRSLVTEGALVTNGQQNYLTTITQLDPLYVDIRESSRALLRLRKQIEKGELRLLNGHEAPVKLILEDGSHYPLEGRLEFSEVRVEPDTGSVVLRATFPNPQRLLLPGMFVHAVLSQGVQENGILVPQEAIGRDNKGHPFVYIVDNASVARIRQVTTGEMLGSRWQVIQGLKAGERVIVAGLQRVAAGAKVNAHERAAKATGAPDIALTINDPSAQ